MKPLLAVRILVAGLLLLAPALKAQGLAGPGPGVPASRSAGRCGTCDVLSLRGTYAFSGTAWQDLSEINPALPPGYAPVSIVGAFNVDGSGGLTGWASINAGGVQLTAEFVNSHFGTPSADCSFPVSLSMRIKEFEGVAGPYSYAGVIAGDASALEIVFMMLGTGPGSHVELDRAKRISMILG
jgi:hypothetical protein